MRRKDREVLDGQEIRAVVDACTCCRIGFCDAGEVYIVPLNFGYVCDAGRYAFYFHGAKEGRKIGLIEKSPRVGFEMDTGYALNPGTTACAYSVRFESVIGNGVVRMIGDAAEKEAALRCIMAHTAGKGDWTFEEKMLDAVCVFRLDVTDMRCKRHG